MSLLPLEQMRVAAERILNDRHTINRFYALLHDGLAAIRLVTDTVARNPDPTLILADLRRCSSISRKIQRLCRDAVPSYCAGEVLQSVLEVAAERVNPSEPFRIGSDEFICATAAAFAFTSESDMFVRRRSTKWDLLAVCDGAIIHLLNGPLTRVLNLSVSDLVRVRQRLFFEEMKVLVPVHPVLPANSAPPRATEAPKPPKQSRRSRQDVLSRIAKALIILRERPALTDSAIATMVDLDPSQLSRNAAWKRARESYVVDRRQVS